MGYLYLAAAIGLEVAATTALKASDGFRNVVPTLGMLIGYGLALLLLSLTLKTLPVGTTYAIWAGVGTALVVLASALAYAEMPTSQAIAGIALIIAGVATIYLAPGLQMVD
jgi:small multidrug resistance pump